MRWVKATLAIGSALLCLLAAVTWVRSYLPRNLHAVPHRGSLILASMSASDEMLDNYGGADQVVPVMTHRGNVYEHFAGFAHVSGTYGQIGAFQIIAIPFWFIVVLTATGPALWWRNTRRRRLRRGGGRCEGCGYDLRATPDHCPECGWNRNGAAVAPAAAPAKPDDDQSAMIAPR